MYTDHNISLLVVQNEIQKAVIGEHSTDFLSVVMICSTVDGHMYPLRQTISEEEFDKNFLKTFLREVLKSSFPLPKKMSLPFSFIYVDSVSLNFNELSLESYLEEVFVVLKHNSKAIIKTFLHIDFMQLLIVIKHLKFKTDTAQKFFLHAIIYLSTIKNLTEFEAEVIDLFLLFDTRHESETITIIKDSFRAKFANEIKSTYTTMIEQAETY